MWGNATWAADDLPNAVHTHGQFVAFRPNNGSHDPGLRNLTANEASNFILEHTPSSFQVMSFGSLKGGYLIFSLSENDGNELLVWH